MRLSVELKIPSQSIHTKRIFLIERRQWIPKSNVFKRTLPAPPTGNAGGPTSPNDSGERSVKTTQAMAIAGTLSATTTPAAAPTAGVKTVFRDGLIANAACVFLSPFGTPTIPF